MLNDKQKHELAKKEFKYQAYSIMEEMIFWALPSTAKENPNLAKECLKEMVDEMIDQLVRKDDEPISNSKTALELIEDAITRAKPKIADKMADDMREIIYPPEGTGNGKSGGLETLVVEDE